LVLLAGAGVTPDLPHDSLRIQLSTVEINVGQLPICSTFVNLSDDGLPLYSAKVLQAAEF
jgi:hypothetical protein